MSAMSKAKQIPPDVRAAKPAKCPFCAVCHSTEDLELNHLDPDGDSTIDNLIVLCSKHHADWHDMRRGNRHADLLRKGIRERKARGEKFGKPAIPLEPIMRAIAEKSTQYNPFSEMTEHEIADSVEVGYTTYCKAKRALKEAIKAEVWPYSWRKPRQCSNRPMYDRYIRRLRGETKGPAGEDL